MKKEKFPNQKNLVESQTQKPTRKQTKTKTYIMQENDKGIFESNLEEYQSPNVVTLSQIGEWVQGYYEGIQPIEYKKTGGIGYLMLLRQGTKQTDDLIAVNAGYDIRRWIQESGFDELMGEYIKITLDGFIDTSQGKLAPMKKYRFAYTEKVAKQLKAGVKQNLRQLMEKTDGVKLLASQNTVSEVWDKEDN